jgi:hypothetical protein
MKLLQNEEDQSQDRQLLRQQETNLFAQLAKLKQPTEPDPEPPAQEQNL